jgi:predicted nucleic acid-binding protein
MARLILDSGAVIAWAAGNQRVRQLIQRAVRERTLILIPAVVIAETTRGGPRDAPVNRAVKSVDEVYVADEAVAREAGRLLASVLVTNVTVDALVVATAARREPTVILTGDVADITALAAGYRHVRVVGV